MSVLRKRIHKLSIITITCAVFLTAFTALAEKKVEYTATYHELMIDGKTYNFTFGIHDIKVKNFEKQDAQKAGSSIKIKELIVQYNQLDTTFKNTIPILYARDLSGNGKFDSWFVIEPNGTITGIEQLSLDEDGWDVAQEIIKNKIQIHKRGFGSFLAAGVYTMLAPVTHSSQGHFLEHVKLQMINLRSLEIQNKRMERLNSCDLAEQQQIIDINEQIKEGWTEIAKAAETNKYRSLPAEITGDAALNVFMFYLAPKYGPNLIKKIVPGAGKMVKSIPGVEAVSDYLAAMTEEIGAVARRQASRITIPVKKVLEPVTTKVAEKFGASVAAGALVRLTIHQKIESTMASLAMGNMASQIVGRALGMAVTTSTKVGSAVSVTVVNSLKVWPLLIANQAGLFIGQARERWAEITKDGVDLRAIKNLMFNKDYLQDSLFHFNQTFWSNGILNNPTLNPYTKYAVMAAVTLVDSVSATRLTKNETDTHRIAFDAGWEITAGIGETALEIGGLDWLKREAKETGQPALVYLGYTVVPLALQSGEMFVEAPASYWYEHSKFGKHSAEENAQKEAALAAKYGERKAELPKAQLPSTCTEPARVYLLPVGTLTEVTKASN